MILQPPSDTRRCDAGPAHRLRRPGRPADWMLSVVFAALLGAAVWKLDHAGGAAAGPVAGHPSSLVGRTADFARELLETLIERDRPQVGLSAGQSAPEGWPMWSSEQAHRPPAPNCIRPDAPRDAAFACD